MRKVMFYVLPSCTMLCYVTFLWEMSNTRPASDKLPLQQEWFWTNFVVKEFLSLSLNSLLSGLDSSKWAFLNVLCRLGKKRQKTIKDSRQLYVYCCRFPLKLSSAQTGKKKASRKASSQKAFRTTRTFIKSILINSR